MPILGLLPDYVENTDGAFLLHFQRLSQKDLVRKRIILVRRLLLKSFRILRLRVVVSLVDLFLYFVFENFEFFSAGRRLDT